MPAIYDLYWHPHDAAGATPAKVRQAFNWAILSLRTRGIAWFQSERSAGDNIHHADGRLLGRAVATRRGGGPVRVSHMEHALRTLREAVAEKPGETVTLTVEIGR